MSSVIPGIIACGSRREIYVGGNCDPYWDDVVLLLRAADNDLTIDVTGKTLTPSGSVSISSTQSKFGGQSIAFSGGTILTPYSTDFNMTTDYTVEYWLYGGSAGQEFFSSSKANVFYMTLGYPHPEEILSWHDASGSIDVSGTALNTTLPLPFTGWNHVAISRQGDTVRSFFNGVKVRETTISVNTDTTAQRFSLGYRTALPAYCLYGYLDQVRITLAARYTTDFPVPTESFGENCYIPISDVPAFVPTIKEVITETPPEFVPDPTPVALTGAGGRMLVNIGSYSYQVRRDAAFYDNLVKFNSSTYEVTNVVQSFGACDPVYAESGRFIGCANTDHTIHSICIDGTYLYVSAYKDLRKYDSSLNIVENVTSSVTYDQLCYANSYLWTTDYVHIYKINPTTLLVETTINFPTIVGVTNYLCRMETDGTHVYININSNASLHKLNCATNEITTYSATGILHTIINGYAYLTTEKVNLSSGTTTAHSLVLSYSGDSNRNYVSNFGTIFTHYTGISTQGIYGKGIIRIIDSIDDSIVSTITNFEELSSVQCGNFCIYNYKKPTGIGLLSEDKLIISNGSASYYQFQEGYSIYELI